MVRFWNRSPNTLDRCPEKRWWYSALDCKNFGRKCLCGLLSGVMDDAKKYISALNQTKTKVQTCTRKCDRRHCRRSLERTYFCPCFVQVWSSLRSSDCLDQPCCALNFECGLRMFFSLQCLVSSVWSWIKSTQALTLMDRELVVSWCVHVSCTSDQLCRVQKSGCKFGAECRKVEEQPNKKPKKGEGKSAVAIVKSVRQLSCVSRDTEPPYSTTISKMGKRVLEPIRRVRFTRAALRQANIREREGPSLGKIQVKIPHQRSPNAMKFEDRSPGGDWKTRAMPPRRCVGTCQDSL